MNTLWQDLRYAARMLMKNPGFTAVAVLTLALGIGANTAIFSVVNATLLRPAPGIADPDRLVTIGRTDPSTSFDNSSYPNYRDIRDQNTVYSGVAAYHGLALSLSGDGRTDRVPGLLVTANYFRVLGVQMTNGRTFDDSEDVLNSSKVAVISHGLWVRRFGSDPGVVGKTLSINGQPATIVGIAGKGFSGTETGDTVEVWVPMAMAPSLLPNWVFKIDEFFSVRKGSWIMIVARLKQGVTFEQAEAETKTIFSRLKAAFPAENKDQGVALMRGVGFDPDTHRQMTRFSALLLGVVALLLLLACANVANLVLARAARRRREIAVRVALGASRGRVLRQLITESLLLAVLGAAIGLLVSLWIAGSLPKMFPSAGFVEVEAAPDWHVLGFTLAVSLITGVLVGIAPALRLSRIELVPALKEAAALSPRLSRLQPLLVAAQLMVSLVLLVGAGLLLRTLLNYNSIDPGFNARNLAMMSIDPSVVGSYDEARLRLFHRQLLERVQVIPGVESITFARVPPVNTGGWGTAIKIPDKPGHQVETTGMQFNTVAPHYFEVMGIPVVRGRSFTPQDSGDAPPAAVINETAARNIWPAEDPIGKTIQLRAESQPRQIIGVVRDIKYRSLIESPRNYIYYPMWQPYPFPQAPTTILLRTKLPQEQVAAAIAGEVQTLDPNLPVYRVRSFAEHIGGALWRQRMAATLITSFALLALLLGMIGIYGVMAYAVTQRMHEIGIRMALGARPNHVLKLMLSQAVRITIGGVLAGIAGALALTRVLSNLLYGVSATDPVTFVFVSLLLTGAALGACLVPVQRAAKVDPMEALRYE